MVLYFSASPQSILSVPTGGFTTESGTLSGVGTSLITTEISSLIPTSTLSPPDHTVPGSVPGPKTQTISLSDVDAVSPMSTAASSAAMASTSTESAPRSTSTYVSLQCDAFFNCVN